MPRGSRQIIAESWDFLDALDADAVHSSRALSEFQTKHGRVMLSRDSEGTRHVLVPIDASDRVRPDTESRGIQLVRSSFNDGGERRHFVDIRCPDPRLYRVFDQVASSMLEALAASAEERPGTVCAQVLESWRALLRRASRPLGATALRGLFGELWYLAQLARHDPSAVEHWCGPDEQPQDFISARGAFEVKTTTRSPVRRVSISSIDQLDDANHDFLVLVVVSASEDPEGVTVPEIVDELVSMGVNGEQLLDRLAKAGLQEADFPEAGKLRLRVRNVVGYRVSEGFPRLVPRSFKLALPAGVTSLRYDVELSGAASFAITEEELRGLEQGFLASE